MLVAIRLAFDSKLDVWAQAVPHIEAKLVMETEQVATARIALCCMVPNRLYAARGPASG